MAVAPLGDVQLYCPDVARYAYVYGVALNSSGEPERGLEVLDAAHRRSPGDRALLQALATISRDAGELERALEYARRLDRLAPNDPGVRQLIDQLERASATGVTRAE